MDTSDTTVWQEIIATVEAASRPLSPSDIAERMPDSDAGYIRKELRRLAGSGKLVQPRRGLYDVPESGDGREQEVPHSTAGDIVSTGTPPTSTATSRRSITDMLDDPERHASNPKAGLVRAGGGLVARGFDADGLLYAVEIVFHLRPGSRDTHHEITSTP